MKVEIWSDHVCPFCYIGKKQFENGLAAFAHNSQVEIKWRSFQLDPSMQYEPGKTIQEVLAEKKGINGDHAKQLIMRVSESAKQIGLEFNLDEAIPANTFHAHRLSHLAAQFDLQHEMEERLFRAYFTEARNIGDIATLFELGVSVGLPAKEIREVLETNTYSAEVNNDVIEAGKLGIRGVPFFLIDNKYVISGAQPFVQFTHALETAWKESEQDKLLLETTTCEIDGNC